MKLINRKKKISNKNFKNNVPVLALDAEAFLEANGVLRNIALPRPGFLIGTIGFEVTGTLSTSSPLTGKRM